MPADKAKKIRTLAVAAGVLVIYGIFVSATGIAIPCVFHRITGLQCPGCGSTRMLSAMLRLDIKGAYAANPFLLVTSPFLAFEVIYEFILTHDNLHFKRVNNVLLIIYCAALIIFGIVRNLSAFRAFIP
jgi:hypothetical protein